MFDDKLFEYLVATDQLDDVLEVNNKKDNSVLKKEHKKDNSEADKKTKIAKKKEVRKNYSLGNNK